MAWARVSNCPVRAKMCRDRAPGWMVLKAAFIVIIGRLRIAGWLIARWCGVVAVSCFLVTLAPLRCLNERFCWGSQ